MKKKKEEKYKNRRDTIKSYIILLKKFKNSWLQTDGTLP